MTKAYEIMLLLRSDNEMQQSALEGVRQKISEAGGTLEKEASIGTQTLSYPIAKQKKGYYHLLNACLEPQKLKDLRLELELVDGLLRFLMISK